jgi:hypothetical protein
MEVIVTFYKNEVPVHQTTKMLVDGQLDEEFDDWSYNLTKSLGADEWVAVEPGTNALKAQAKFLNMGGAA